MAMNNQRPRDKWDIIDILAPIISALLIIIGGSMASTSIQDAIKERQLQISSGQAMQELLQILMSKDSTIKIEQFKASAYALAAFGPVATLPLIKIIDDNNAYSEDKKLKVAKDALLYSSLGNPKPACAALRIAIGKRSTVFRWHTQQAAIELIGDLKCENVAEEIEDYWNFFQQIKLDSKGKLNEDSSKAIKAIARDTNLENINQRNIDLSIEHLCKTIQNIDRFHKKSRKAKARKKMLQKCMNLAKRKGINRK